MRPFWEIGRGHTESYFTLEAAGKNGGFMLSPSDHFFEAEPALLEAFVDEARQCRYETADLA